MRGRWSRPLALLLVLAGLFSVGIGLGRAHGLSLAELFRGPGKPPPGEFPVLAPSRPLRIEIPSIKVKAYVHGVGVAADGAVATPSLLLRNEAGWFQQGPTPGQYGPAIIVGHVDTKDRPGVFHRLNEMKPGQRIEITRRDGKVAVFEVNTVERFAKDALPVKRVYQDFSRPGLRVITCGGRWVGGKLGYADNIVVFASLVSTRKG
ncbi:class F sortase [Catellatospora sp. KI3]|uniref:class F sortase n=1 Tax=Catellatospora sp. KI3 TaxID=3041620 RepID=UPI0024828B01|nr:class F sortase [Catellatospora sp. KI3]MDI1464344.1 class F sortase [Catellatospora sp. KI3]